MARTIFKPMNPQFRIKVTNVMHRAGRYRWLQFLLLAALVIAVYGPTVRYNLTLADDDQLVLNHYQFNQNPQNIVRVFAGDVFFNRSLMYRPILTISFMVDSWIGKTAPWVYHLSNVILHAITVCLVFVMLLELSAPPAVALFLACVFAVHPALTMAVAWIPGRNDVILGLWSVIAVLSLLSYLRGRTWMLLLHCVSFLIVLFTKESAILLTLMLVALAVRYGRITKRVGLLMGFWAIVSILWLLLRESVIGLNYQLTIHRSVSPVIAAAGLLQYLGKAAVPIQLSPLPSLSLAGIGTGVAAFAALVALYRYSHMRDRALFLIGVLWFITILAPTLFVSVLSEDIFLEHRLYVPMIGLLIAGAQVQAGGFISRYAMRIIIAAIVIIGLAYATMVYRRVFTNDIVFWKTAVLSTPESSIAHNGLGSILLRRGNTDQATEQCLEALRLNPHNNSAEKNLELIASSVQCLQRDDERSGVDRGDRPSNDQAAMTRVSNLLQRADFSTAEPLLRQLLRQRPKDPTVLFYRGLVADKLQNYQQAAIYYQRALAFGLNGPAIPYAYYNLALIYHSNGDTARSRQALDSAYRLRPDWKGAKE